MKFTDNSGKIWELIFYHQNLEFYEILTNKVIIFDENDESYYYDVMSYLNDKIILSTNNYDKAKELFFNLKGFYPKFPTNCFMMAGIDKLSYLGNMFSTGIGNGANPDDPYENFKRFWEMEIKGGMEAKFELHRLFPEIKFRHIVVKPIGSLASMIVKNDLNVEPNKNITNYILPKNLEFYGLKVLDKKYLDMFVNHDFPKKTNDDDGKIRLFNNIGKCGSGGIHMVHAYQKIFEVKEDTILLLDDVKSYYPNLIVNYNMLSENADMGKFIMLIDKRYEIVAKEGKKKPKQVVLKLLINAIYGQHKLESSLIYEPMQQLNISYTGQIILLVYAEILHNMGFKLIQSNTDGVAIELKKSDLPKFMEMREIFQKTFKIELGYVEASKIIQWNVNNYLMVLTDKNETIVAKGSNLKQHNYYCVTAQKYPIVQKAVVDYLLHNKSVEKTIKDEMKILPFCLATTKSKDCKEFFKGDYFKKQIKDKTELNTLVKTYPNYEHILKTSSGKSKNLSVIFYRKDVIFNVGVRLIPVKNGSKFYSHLENETIRKVPLHSNHMQAYHDNSDWDTIMTLKQRDNIDYDFLIKLAKKRILEVL